MPILETLPIAKTVTNLTLPKIYGLILARGGSKTIPNKNTKLLNGKPLIAYIIEQALKTKSLDQVWLSSDSKETLEVASGLGISVILRPPELAQGDKPIESIEHFLENKKECDVVVLLNACCPLTKVQDIENAIQIFQNVNCDSVVSLVEDFSCHPSKLCGLGKFDKVLTLGIFKTGERQGLDRIYKRNTAIYLAKKEVIMNGTLFGSDIRGYVMPKERSWDINDEFDWKIAEYLIKN